MKNRFEFDDKIKQLRGGTVLNLAQFGKYPKCQCLLCRIPRAELPTLEYNGTLSLPIATSILTSS
jgi:hypothetical protein